jgi:hypothetical protein
MKSIRFIFSFLLISLFLPAYSQTDTIDSPLTVSDTLQLDFGLFTNDEILNISLRFDVTQYQKKKPKEEYLDAILTYHINDKDSVNKAIRLKTRGEMRNGYCNFPPIRLNFKKTKFDYSDLDKIEKVKMVTHCQSGNEDYLLREYLTYKLYSVLTDASFRVRLVKVEYINTSKKSKPVNSYAFWIEPEEMLAERLNSVPVNSLKLTQKNILPSVMDRVAIFNYMIGNTDWSVPNLHNVKAFSGLSLGNQGLGVLVPYDFDYSGLVNADYAIPYEPLGLKSVRERRYVGICRSEDVFINALREFTEKKEEFYRVINEFPVIDEKSKKDMIRYLETFYSGFDKRNSIVYDLLGGCNNF